MTLDETSGAISWTPDARQAGEHMVILHMEDGCLPLSQSFVIDIFDALNLDFEEDRTSFVQGTGFIEVGLKSDQVQSQVCLPFTVSLLEKTTQTNNTSPLPHLLSNEVDRVTTESKRQFPDGHVPECSVQILVPAGVLQVVLSLSGFILPVVAFETGMGDGRMDLDLQVTPEEIAQMDCWAADVVHRLRTEVEAGNKHDIWERPLWYRTDGDVWADPDWWVAVAERLVAEQHPYNPDYFPILLTYRFEAWQERIRQRIEAFFDESGNDFDEWRTSPKKRPSRSTRINVAAPYCVCKAVKSKAVSTIAPTDPRRVSEIRLKSRKEEGEIMKLRNYIGYGNQVL